MTSRPGKRSRANEQMIPQSPLPAAEAIAAVKSFKAPKFDQSIDVVMVLGVDSKQPDQNLRGSVSLPRGIGKNKRVVAFCQSDVAPAARAAGAVEAGAEDLVEKIEKGWMEFDVAVASPDMMRVVSRLGKVLGPKGLMPSPKAGTVTPNVPEAVREYAAGKVEYRTDKGGNVHAIIGKMSFPTEHLVENLSHFMTTIERQRPATAKGVFVKKVVVSGTMTPGVQVKLETVAAE